MGRYRKVTVRVWGDEKFRRLSAPAPNGQMLWLFLICGPHTGPIPGLSSAGELGLSEALSWDVDAFRKCFAEIEGMGMAEADWLARVVWLPRALTHNEPESPNVVRMWRQALDEIPDSPVKDRATAAITEYLRERGRAWLEAWAPGKASGKASPKASGKASAKASGKALANQEQEQYQEQDQKQLHRAQEAAHSAKGVDLLAHFVASFKARHGEQPTVDRRRDSSILSRLAREHSEPVVRQRLEIYLASQDQFIVGAGYSIPVFHTRFTALGISTNGAIDGSEISRAWRDQPGGEQEL